MIAVIDIETTGTDYWRSEIIALSVGLYKDSGEIVAEKDLYFRPVRMKFWSDDSEAIHGISKDLAMSFQDANKSWGEFFEFLDSNIEKPIPFVCHALWFGHYFDRAFIECQMFLTNHHWLLRKYFSRSISTHTMAQKLKTHGYYNFEKLSLDYLSKWFKIDLDHHDAKSDRSACAKLYFYMKDKYHEIEEEELRKEAQRQTDESEKDSTRGTIPVKKGGRKPRKTASLV